MQKLRRYWLVLLPLLLPHGLVAQAQADTVSPYSHEHPAWKLPKRPGDACPTFRGHPDGAGGFYYLEYELREPTLPVPDNPRPHGVGVAGRVVMQFIVDTNGEVERASLRVLRSDAPELTKVAAQTLLASLFTPPLTVGGCRVRQRVEQPFTFQ